MPADDKNIQVYADLAALEQERGATQERDRFLILAGDAALAAGQPAEAEKFRARLLEHNPHHLLRPYRSLTEAMKSSDVYSYVADLRASYPPDDAAQLLAKLTGKEPPPAQPDPGPVPSPGEALPGFQEPPALEEPAPPPPFYALRELEPVAVPVRSAPLRERPPQPGPTLPEAEEDGEDSSAGFGAWLADGLFVVVLVAGLALTVYTLGRPFLGLPDSPFR